MHDTEDRYWWYRHADQQEQAFVKMMRSHGFDVRRNPEKLLDPKVPDLMADKEKLSELKSQNTPFFKAAVFYGLPARYTVTFNRDQYEFYLEKWPDLYIYFWPNWTATEWRDPTWGTLYVVEPMNRVFGIRLPDLRPLVRKAKEHWYGKRKNEVRPNHRSSFLLDVRDMPMLLRLDEPPSFEHPERYIQRMFDF